jgi:FixJ family two-component response regulator
MTEESARTVFVVDGDPSERMGLSRVLRSAGLRWRTFENAIQFFSEGDASFEGCIVIDLGASPMSGREFRAHMREAELDLPIIALSGSDDEASVQAACSLGARYFFHKPVDAQALLDAIAWVNQSNTLPDEAAEAEPKAVPRRRPIP